MLQTSSAFKSALKSGNYTRVDYLFLLRANADPAQTYATADFRYAEVDYDHPELFQGVSFPALAALTDWQPPREQVLGGRDQGALRLADPEQTFRNYFNRNGWVGHRIEVIWDYRHGDPLQHQIVHYYLGFAAGGQAGEDETGRHVVLRMTGPFTQLDPNLSANVTPAQQKGRRDPGDTCLDDLQDVWSVRIGRKPGE